LAGFSGRGGSGGSGGTSVFDNDSSRPICRLYDARLIARTVARAAAEHCDRAAVGQGRPARR
jgi:hypothetical protein